MNELLDYIRQNYSVNNKTSISYNSFRKVIDGALTTHKICFPGVSEDRFYHASSIYLSNPSIGNPKIFDAKIRFVGFYDSVPDSLCHNIVKKDTLKTLQGTISADGIKYLKELPTQRISVVREIILRDGRCYEVLELWDMEKKKIRVMPFCVIQELRQTVRGCYNSRKALRPPIMTLSCETDVDNQQHMYVAMHTYHTIDRELAIQLVRRISPKVERWVYGPFKENDPVLSITKSLDLIDHLEYFARYSEKKARWYPILRKVWKEVDVKTNPEKFILEELGIAIYLDIYYKDYECTPRNFVDLGCGNGLLSYFLKKLGWEGYGIDTRRRNLWSVFSNHVELKEQTVNAFDESLFKHADERTVFIGNHPDQLTPWIPIIASRTKSRFFILPCCAYKFDQTKFDRRSGYSKSSTYRNYIMYVWNLASAVGYNCAVDRLRIPSTKRICLIGDYDEEKDLLPLEDTQFGEEIESCRNINFKDKLTNRLENGTKLPRAAVEKVIYKIFRYILEKPRLTIYARNKDFREDCMCWNRGSRQVRLRQLIDKVLEPSELHMFKNQGKGLQTILKNHSHIFTLNNGFVQLRVPSRLDKTALKDKRKLKVSPCYFYMYHPNGCPLTPEDCKFDHDPIWGLRELFERPLDFVDIDANLLHIRYLFAR